jgi:tripartite-type tricarboxylate transporter receptor subunit TctC
MTRKTLLAVSFAAIIISPWAAIAQQTESWPTKPVRIIVAYPPGGATDTQARILGKHLSDKWQQPVVIENKPGGNTVIATDPVAKAAPDGYTLLLSAMPFALNPILLDKLPYDTNKDLAPVTTVTTISNILVAPPSAGIKNVQDLITKAKSDPDSISYASAGAATATHLSGELFSNMANIKMTHVPYKGSAAAHQDGVLPHIKSGRVIPLGVTSKQRLPWLPDVPTIAEQGLPGYDVSAWYGIFAPGGTDPKIVSKLAADITEVVRAPELQSQWEAMGAMAGGGTPEEFQRFLNNETARWGKLIKEQNIKY